MLLLLSLFFNPSVTTCHLPYILLRKTQRRRVRCISLSLLFRFYTCHPVMLRGTAMEELKNVRSGFHPPPC
nr:MAG TPA: hypothetical protein [Caudoviricetes sp.]